LAVGDADGVFGGATERALATFQRKEAVLSEPGVLDDDTRLRLVQPSRVRDVQAVLRALRERVADAAGLIEDGSARGEQVPVLGVLLPILGAVLGVVHARRIAPHGARMPLIFHRLLSMRCMLPANLFWTDF
jgi:hypothetical protein